MTFTVYRSNNCEFGVELSTYRLFQMSPRQINIMCVLHQHLAHLQMCSCFHFQWRLERKQCLQALYAPLYIRRTHCTKMFGQTQQTNVAGILTRCHSQSPPNTPILVDSLSMLYEMKYNGNWIVFVARLCTFTLNVSIDAVTDEVSVWLVVWGDYSMVDCDICWKMPDVGLCLW